MSAQEYYAGFLEDHDVFNDAGEPISTSNPDAKWDFYSIGGRWDGWINDRQTSDASLEDNTATTQQVVAMRKTPYAIVTPDGQWHETAGGSDSLDNNGNWDDQALSLLGKYAGHRVVLIDAHI